MWSSSSVVKQFLQLQKLCTYFLQLQKLRIYFLQLQKLILSVAKVATFCSLVSVAAESIQILSVAAESIYCRYFLQLQKVSEYSISMPVTLKISENNFSNCTVVDAAAETSTLLSAAAETNTFCSKTSYFLQLSFCSYRNQHASFCSCRKQSVSFCSCRNQRKKTSYFVGKKNIYYESRFLNGLSPKVRHASTWHSIFPNTTIIRIPPTTYNFRHNT